MDSYSSPLPGFSSISDPILAQIFDFCSPKPLGNCALACRRCRIMIYSLEGTWREIYSRRWQYSHCSLDAPVESSPITHSGLLLPGPAMRRFVTRATTELRAYAMLCELKAAPSKLALATTAWEEAAPAPLAGCLELLYILQAMYPCDPEYSDIRRVRARLRAPAFLSELFSRAARRALRRDLALQYQAGRLYAALQGPHLEGRMRQLAAAAVGGGDSNGERVQLEDGLKVVCTWDDLVFDPSRLDRQLDTYARAAWARLGLVPGPGEEGEGGGGGGGGGAFPALARAATRARPVREVVEAMKAAMFPPPGPEGGNEEEEEEEEEGNPAAPAATAAPRPRALRGAGQGEYYAPGNSVLAAVLARGRGIPLTLAVAFAAACRRAGLDARRVLPVGMPGHFLLFFTGGGGGGAEEEGEEEGFYLDAFHGGKVLSKADCHQMLRAFGVPDVTNPKYLEPVNHQEVWARCVRNLVGVYQGRRRDPARQHGVLSMALGLVDRGGTQPQGQLRLARAHCAVELGMPGEARRDLALWQLNHSWPPPPSAAGAAVAADEHYDVFQEQLLKHALGNAVDTLAKAEAALESGAVAGKSRSPDGPAQSKSSLTEEEKGATETSNVAGNQNVKLLYCVGQVIFHRKYGYRGVIRGWDRRCEAGAEWCAQMGVHRLAHGASQPFYHVLVDGATRPGPPQETYVAQENVTLLAGPCKQRGAWPVRHPDVGRYFDRCVAAAAAAGGDGPSTTASSPPGAREEGGHGGWGSNEEEDAEEEEEHLARGGQGGAFDGESVQGRSGGECIQGGGKGASSEEEGGREGSEPLLLSQAAVGCVVYRMGPITSLQYPEDAKAFRTQTTPLVQPW